MCNRLVFNVKYLIYIFIIMKILIWVFGLFVLRFKNIFIKLKVKKNVNDLL